MILHIHDHIKLSDIQERLTKCFPLLKLNFYTKKHADKGSCNKEDAPIDPEMHVSDIRKNHYNGDLQIFSFNTVSDVENSFRQKFDLNVQIMRKEQSGWVETTNTDKFTLAQQTEMAKFSLQNSLPMYRDQLKEYHDL